MAALVAFWRIGALQLYEYLKQVPEYFSVIRFQICMVNNFHKWHGVKVQGTRDKDPLGM
jgi:hypothetical protein